MASERELRAFLKSKALVRFERRVGSYRTTGRIVGVGRGLFLLACVDDSIRCNGFEVHHHRDVRRLQAEPRAAFLETVLRRRRDRLPAAPRLQLDGMRALLRSAGRLFPLVTLHRERVDPGVCHIGAVLEVGARRVVLVEIRPDGTWWPEPCGYALREITRVDFGGAYEDALHLVGGRPRLPRPAPARGPRATTTRRRPRRR